MKLVFDRRASAILYALLVGRADRRPFLLPANICPIVPITFLKAGVPFEFVDISPQHLHMDLEAAAERLQGGDFGGLLYAHTYGEPFTPFDFFAEVKAAYPTLLLIDDRCLCTPDLEADSHNPADVLLYSSGYAKIVDLGFGGYAFLRDDLPYMPRPLPFRQPDLDALEQAYKESLVTRQPFVYSDSDWLESGGDLPPWEQYRCQLNQGLVQTQTHRQEINALYAARLPLEWQLPPSYQNWRFNLRLPRRDQVLGALFEAGLFASAHYASLAGIMAPGRCPQAETLAAEVINLFNDRHYTLAMAEKTCAIISRQVSA